MQELFNAEKYRRLVQFYEKELQLIEDDPFELNQLFLPVINLLHYFPTASQEARVLQEQLAILKEQIIESIAVFNTLFAIAQAKENKENLPVYRLLEDQLKLQVRPYVDFFEYVKEYHRVKKIITKKN